MSDELLEIKVRSSTPPNQLAGSIYAAYMEGKEIVLSAIGPVPISQALKAVCVCNRYLAPKGVILAIIPTLLTRPIIDKQTNESVQWVVSLLRLRNVVSIVNASKTA